MEDPELIQLQELKAKLLQKAHDLIAKLKKQEADDQSSVTLKLYHVNFSFIVNYFMTVYL